jgi:hypothetical protein
MAGDKPKRLDWCCKELVMYKAGYELNCYLYV